MKRFLGAILLLGLVAGISYLKTVWDDYRQQGWIEEQMAVAKFEIDSLTTTIDSLQNEIDSTQKRVFGMMARQQENYEAQSDSLRIQISRQEEQILSLQDKLSGAQQRLASIKAKSVKKPSGIDHKEVVRYFRNKYEKLPGDLTDYERKVALNELRDETAKRFSISSSKVDEIIKQAGLN